MNDAEWHEETNWRLNRVVNLFKQKELAAIVDFIQTCRNERETAEKEEE